MSAPFRALHFEDPRIEARFQRGYYASQYHTDLVFFVILVLCQVRSSAAVRLDSSVCRVFSAAGDSTAAWHAPSAFLSFLR